MLPAVDRREQAPMGMQGLGSLFGARKISARATPEEPRPRARPASRPTPDLALAWLKDGNGQFVTAGGPVAGHARDEIAGLAKGQAPIAIIVGCSDSRVAPEILFQCRMGDLFVVRTAGASVDPAALGSIEYGVEHLGCPLVVVLGHSGCGAVTAATKVLTDNADYDGPIESLVLPILPAVLKAKSAGANDLVDASTREHVGRMVKKLRAFPAFAAAAGQGRLKIVGARYDLASGRVEFFG